MKKFISVLLVLVLALGCFTACSSNTRLKVTGPTGTYTADMTDGVYLYYLLSAYNSAYSDSGSDKDFLKKTPEGSDVTYAQRIQQEAAQNSLLYVYMPILAQQVGVSLTDDEKTAAKTSAGTDYTNQSTTYSKNGITQSTCEAVSLSTALKGKLLEYYYGQGGEHAVSENDLLAWAKDNRATISYTACYLVDSSYNALDDATKTQAVGYAKDAIASINDKGADAATAIAAAGASVAKLTGIDAMGPYTSTISASPDSDFYKAVFATAIGDSGYYSDDSLLYMFTRTVGYDSSTKANYLSSMLAAMQGDALDELLVKSAADAGYSVSTAALERKYKPSKISV